MKTLSRLIVAVVVGLAPALRAARLMPDPGIDVAEVRALIGGHFAQPVALGELEFEKQRQGALGVALRCDAELVLQESFYREVPRTDGVFASVQERLAELDQARRQLDLVPHEFITSMVGQKSSAGLAFLQHTFIRTTVPAGTKARVEQTIVGRRGPFFWGGHWEWSCPVFRVAAWEGRPIGAFRQPLRVDTPEFQRQLADFLESARKTLDEVDDLSARYLAKVSADRAALFEALPVGAVMKIDVKDEVERPVFLEVKSVDAPRGVVEFSVAGGYASRAGRLTPLVGMHPDAGEELRTFIAQRLQAKRAATVAEVAVEPVVEAPVPVAAGQPTPSRPPVSRLVRVATTVRLMQEGTSPTIIVNEETPAVALARVPPDLVAEERDRFRRETEELVRTFEPGKVYGCTVDNRSCYLAAIGGEGAVRRFVFQLDGDGNEQAALTSSLLDIEREHPALRLEVARDSRHFVGQAFELIRTGADSARLDGRFGAVSLQPAVDRVLRASGRIVTPERKALLDELTAQHPPGLYQRRAGRFEGLPATPEPTQTSGLSGMWNSVTAVFKGSQTVQIPATVEVIKMSREEPLYFSHPGGSVKALKLTKTKSSYEFQAIKGSTGFVPLASLSQSVSARQLDDGVFEYTLRGIQAEGVFALVETTDQGQRYHLVTFEP